MTLNTANQIHVFHPTFAIPMGPAYTVRKAISHCDEMLSPTPV